MATESSSSAAVAADAAGAVAEPVTVAAFGVTTAGQLKARMQAQVTPVATARKWQQ